MKNKEGIPSWMGLPFPLASLIGRRKGEAVRLTEGRFFYLPDGTAVYFYHLQAIRSIKGAANRGDYGGYVSSWPIQDFGSAFTHDGDWLPSGFCAKGSRLYAIKGNRLEFVRWASLYITDFLGDNVNDIPDINPDPDHDIDYVRLRDFIGNDLDAVGNTTDKVKSYPLGWSWWNNPNQ